MSLFHPFNVRAMRLAGVIAATALAGACADSPTATTSPVHFNVAAGDAPKQVYLCNVGPSGFTGQFHITISNGGGVLTLGSDVSLPAFASLADIQTSPTGDCPVIWDATYPIPAGVSGPTTVTVTEVNKPASINLLRIVAYDRTGEQWLEPAPLSMSASVSVDVDNSGRFYFKHDGAIVPPSCSGLTPGYWKNWKNHYTTAQFQALVNGTIAGGSISLANSILSISDGSKSSAIDKLRKFVLANQLTLNLMANPGFPNPSGAQLSGDCTAWLGSPNLGGSLTTALQMLANPSAYSKMQILEVKDVLDALANLGGG